MGRVNDHSAIDRACSLIRLVRLSETVLEVTKDTLGHIFRDKTTAGSHNI